MSEKEIITTVTKELFMKYLQNNKEAFIIKFGAEWCSPCKKIEGLVKENMNKLPNNVTCAIVDVDENFEIYAFFKNKKILHGIPAIFAYKKGNVTHIPDDLVVGADENEISIFFQKYMNESDLNTTSLL
jgi:thiol-disulfide isomerase/thioredoxin